MKLAQALILRADAQKRIAQLEQRLARSAQVQEGEQPPEEPQQLMAELETVLTELADLIKRINKTNSVTEFQERTLSEMLAERDILMLKRNALNYLIQKASFSERRYSRSEIRFVSTVEIADIQRQIDNLARDCRELDSQIQALNWQTDLIEA